MAGDRTGRRPRPRRTDSLERTALRLPPLSRAARLGGAGDVTVTTDAAGYPVEVQPYTDPFAPFNPQAPDAPRLDALTFNPAYLDEYRNFGEGLVDLYRGIAADAPAGAPPPGAVLPSDATRRRDEVAHEADRGR